MKYAHTKTQKLCPSLRAGIEEENNRSKNKIQKESLGEKRAVKLFISPAS